jgi:hypothetical protein
MAGTTRFKLPTSAVTYAVIRGGRALGQRCDEHSGIRFAELATHPLFLHAELDPEREEDENENDEPARLGDRNRHAKKAG